MHVLIISTLVLLIPNMNVFALSLYSLTKYDTFIYPVSPRANTVNVSFRYVIWRPVKYQILMKWKQKHTMRENHFP